MMELSSHTLAGLYILDENKNVRRASSTREWAEWTETSDRIVEQTKVGPIFVSTIFLGIDYSFHSDKLKLFETMIFEGPYDGLQVRTDSYVNAQIQHHEILRKYVIEQTNPWPYMKAELAGFWDSYTNTYN